MNTLEALHEKYIGRHISTPGLRTFDDSDWSTHPVAGIVMDIYRPAPDGTPMFLVETYTGELRTIHPSERIRLSDGPSATPDDNPADREIDDPGMPPI